jgi:hypothetical protein
MRPNLTWREEDNNTKRARIRHLTYYLYAGLIELAVVEPANNSRTTSYRVIFWLPQIPTTTYLPLEKAKDRAITLVNNWFDNAFLDMSTLNDTTGN